MSERPQFEVRLTDDGFKILERGRLRALVRWADVRGAAVFKRDLFTVDLICLGIYLNSREFVEVGEDSDGFEVLIGALAQRYPDFDCEWRPKVMFPAFETCWTVVCGDAPEPRECAACGFDLRGAEGGGRCPECGAVWDPEACLACRGHGWLTHRTWVWASLGGMVAGAGLMLLSGFVPGSWTWLRQLLKSFGVMSFLVAVVALVSSLPSVCRECDVRGKVSASGRVSR